MPYHYGATGLAMVSKVVFVVLLLRDSSFLVYSFALSVFVGFVVSEFNESQERASWNSWICTTVDLGDNRSEALRYSFMYRLI